MPVPEGRAAKLNASASPPIGVFDSGLGGLSVLREIRTLLPAEHLVYVADSAWCPYGTRPAAVIRERSTALTRYLVEAAGAKVVVVACNTATTAAVDSLRALFPQVPIVGMEPAVKPAAASTQTSAVGVLATGATLGGERFAALVERWSDGVEVLTQPCPGLVEQVEVGDLDGPLTEAMVRGFVAPLLARRVDTLVLGCTHYPFLRDTIQRVVGPGVRLLDAGGAVARQTQRLLAEAGTLGTGAELGRVRFVTTGDPALVGPVLARLWPEPVASLERVPL